MIHINVPKGFGDAIMLRAVTFHLLDRGESVTVYTKWPDVFQDINPVPHGRFVLKSLRDLNDVRDDLEERGLLRHGTYHLYRGGPIPEGETIFSLVCKNARIHEPVSLEMRWEVKNHGLVRKIREKAGGKRILVYQPIKVANYPEQELLRPSNALLRGVLVFHPDCFRVKIGHPRYVKNDDYPCDLDLFGEIPISDTFDICTTADLFLADPSFINVIAEALGTPYVCLFTRSGLESYIERVNTVTPERVVHKKSLATVVVDD